MSDVTVRRLIPADAEASVALRLEMLDDSPGSFLADPENDRGCRVDEVHKRLGTGQIDASFGVFSPDLVGTVGLFKQPREKASHRAHIWGMYVAPGARGGGCGRLLLNAVVDYARSLEGVSHLNISVSETAPAARSLYLSAGFRIWGEEPDAMRVDGKLLAETHMVLVLDRGSSVIETGSSLSPSRRPL